MALLNEVSWWQPLTTHLGHIRGSMAGTWFLYASNSDSKAARSNFSSLRIGALDSISRFRRPPGLTLFIPSFLEAIALVNASCA